MSAAASAQVLTSTSRDDKPGLSTMAFISDTVTLSRVSADLFNMTLGKANIREGTIDAALAIGEWPRDLDLLIVDLADAADPIADAAALKTAVPGGCHRDRRRSHQRRRPVSATCLRSASTTIWPCRSLRAPWDGPSSAHSTFASGQAAPCRPVNRR